MPSANVSAWQVSPRSYECWLRPKLSGWLEFSSAVKREAGSCQTVGKAIALLVKHSPQNNNQALAEYLNGRGAQAAVLSDPEVTLVYDKFMEDRRDLEAIRAWRDRK